MQLVVYLLLLLVLIKLTEEFLHSFAVIYFIFLLLLFHLVQSLSLVHLRENGGFVGLLTIALVDVVLILQLKEQMVSFVSLDMILNFGSFDSGIVHKTLLPPALHFLNSVIVVFSLLDLALFQHSIVFTHLLVLVLHDLILLILPHLFGVRLV